MLNRRKFTVLVLLLVTMLVFAGCRMNQDTVSSEPVANVPEDIEVNVSERGKLILCSVKEKYRVDESVELYVFNGMSETVTFSNPSLGIEADIWNEKAGEWEHYELNIIVPQVIVNMEPGDIRRLVFPEGHLEDTGMYRLTVNGSTEEKEKVSASTEIEIYENELD